MDELRNYTVYVSERIPEALARAWADIDAGGDLDAHVPEVVAAADGDVAVGGPWYTLLFHARARERGGSGPTRLLLRTPESYALSEVVAALTVGALVEGKVPAGAHAAADVLDARDARRPGRRPARRRDRPRLDECEGAPAFLTWAPSWSILARGEQAGDDGSRLARGHPGFGLVVGAQRPLGTTVIPQIEFEGEAGARVAHVEVADVGAGDGHVQSAGTDEGGHGLDVAVELVLGEQFGGLGVDGGVGAVPLLRDNGGAGSAWTSVIGARSIHAFDSTPINGPLQTPEYAEALMRAVDPTDSASQIEWGVELRMTRQRILGGDEPAELHVLMDEAALRRIVGGREGMRAQLRHLLERAEEPHIEVRVIPFDVVPWQALTEGSA